MAYRLSSSFHLTSAVVEGYAWSRTVLCASILNAEAEVAFDCRAAPSAWANMAESAAEVGADIAAYPKGGLPLRPGLSADELADMLAIYAHVLPATANAADAVLAEA